jgi:hypothetical protein
MMFLGCLFTEKEEQGITQSPNEMQHLGALKGTEYVIKKGIYLSRKKHMIVYPHIPTWG